MHSLTRASIRESESVLRMSKKQPLNMPCMKSDGLKVFPVTANQRMLLGKDIFLETHCPIQLLRKSDEQISEIELLQQMQNTTGLPPGNRVFVLFGAAGSGKSELMAWLELMLTHQSPDLPIARITRTDLDALSIVERFQHWLTGSYFEQATYDRWQQMRQKPRTLAKLLVLQTLEILLENDDQITSIYYRLVDLVEDRIRDVLQIEQPPIARHVDILTHREFDNCLGETVLTVPITFEVFRQTLLTNLMDYLLEGTRIRETLQALSAHLYASGHRPILLIDDLVQSISIFATDFLDYFITLEAGHWDIVVGLTPASLQEDPRHREILERITYLDTIDDRVEKLWLSDEGGRHSYFLNENNCHKFALSYLQAFRHINGVICDTCPALSRCRSITSDDDVLAPFTREALVRMYRAIPANKGRVRYFLMILRALLEAYLNHSTFADMVSQYVQVDLAIELSDEEIRHLLAWYAPLNIEDDVIHPSADLLTFFGFQIDIQLLPVQMLSVPESLPHKVDEAEIKVDPTMVAVAQWLNGKTVNRQLLHDLRKGTAKWLKAIMAFDALYREGIASPKRVLRYQRVEMSTNPPISLQDADAYEGIRVNQEISHNAYRLASYFRASGQSAKSLERELTTDQRMLPVIMTAEAFRMQVWCDLENAIGMSLSQFAFYSALIVWIHTDVPDDIQHLIPFELSKALQFARKKTALHPVTISEQLVRNADALFSDFFRLRQNLYDGNSLRLLSQDINIDGVIARMELFNADRIGLHYYLGEMLLSEFVSQLQRQIHYLLEAQTRNEMLENLPLSYTARQLLESWQRGEHAHLQQIAKDDLTTLQCVLPDVYQRLVVILQS